MTMIVLKVNIISLTNFNLFTNLTFAKKWNYL